MGSKSKIDRFIPREGVPAFFRQIADAMETGAEGELACLKDFSKLKIGLKEEFGQIAIKLRVRGPRVCGEESPEEAVAGAMPSYKDLKKRMKRSFKVISGMVHGGQLPPREAVESFLTDSELMIRYPGYGDEFYDEYAQACRAFEEAYHSSNPDALTETVDTLAVLKSRCHAIHD